MRVAAVVLPTPVDREFDYLIPAPLAGRVERGMRVVVPFGRRQMTGFVTALREDSGVARDKLKAILDVPDEAPLAGEDMMRLTRWMADYYACSWGEALEAVIPAVIRRQRVLRTVNILRLARPRAETAEYARMLDAKGEKSERSPFRKQAKVLRTLLTFDDDFRENKLAEKLGFSTAPIQTLRKQGWLTVERVPIEDSIGIQLDALDDTPPEMTQEQADALKIVTPLIDRDAYGTVLLAGITGSGKTEIYMRALSHALDHGKSGIVLVPEIALTGQTVRRFKRRLGAKAGVAVLHSAMTDKDRRREWKRIVEGEARVVIGPRSAVFAPVKDLGLIVVDEEHEPGYKQDNTPRYHARDVAVMRAFQQHAVCLLGSATPALESAYNARKGRYKLALLHERVAGRALPEAVIVDMSEECRVQRRFTFFSRMLLTAVGEAVRHGKQAMLFLNRRGYFTCYVCANCRSVLSCPNCAVPMSLHQAYKQCICHYCYETIPPPRVCPVCKTGAMEARGAGTELIEHEMRERFTGLRVARMDSDLMKKREDYEKTLEAFHDGELDVLVGTQMIAKGLDFPNITVVGIIHADLNLHMADFRAQERTFQLLTQVAGRAGRGNDPGRVFVQTFSPRHPCIEAARSQNYWNFYEHELAQRKVARYPPYCRLLAVTVEARERRKGEETANTIKADADDLSKQHKGAVLDVLGPAPAPIARIRGRHRLQILVKMRDHHAMELAVERLKRHVKHSESLRVILDVDPYSLL